MLAHIYEDNLQLLVRGASISTLKRMIRAPQYEESWERRAVAGSKKAGKLLPIEYLVTLSQSQNYTVPLELSKNEVAMKRLPMENLIKLAYHETINVNSQFAQSRVAMSRLPVSVIIAMQRGRRGVGFATDMGTQENLAANPEVAKKLSWKQLEYFVVHYPSECMKYCLASNEEAVKKMPTEFIASLFNDPSKTVRDKIRESKIACMAMEKHLNSKKKIR